MFAKFAIQQVVVVVVNNDKSDKIWCITTRYAPNFIRFV